ncbi:glycosyltransferase [Sporolactobacillus kofuensis]|uniref:Glycosyltransferase n=1 Tax=Sporolactobacillus kofuensis TaxID=269672 RepID=A0ABW1WFC7_9BACL|nr:glycosyltransferase [Sporolactobacillus kofuensis]MCO7174941.1 glycosyltransferase [Sporolactobacillus kofuensis]
MKTIHVVVGAGLWEQDGLRYRRHRLADFLAAQPNTRQVFWICPTPHHGSITNVGEQGLIEQWPVQDLLPQKTFRFGRYLSFFHKWQLTQLIHHLERFASHEPIYLWYTFPGFPILSQLFPWDKVIYDCSDLWTASIGGKRSLITRMRSHIISQAEQRIIDRADLIFCTSDYLHQQTVLKLPELKRNRVITLENGVDYTLFSKPVDRSKRYSVAEGKLVLGYIGGIKPKLHFALLNKLAEKKPDWQLLLVGPDGTNGDPEFARLIKRDNVDWIAGVPPYEVPHYMQLIAIGLMPYKSSPYNHAVFPLKLFEFLAAGKPAIGIHLPSTKKYEQQGCYQCVEREDVNQLIKVCEQMAVTIEQPEAVEKRKVLAQSKDWSKIFDTMLSYL